jgi:hypothetical protein
LFLGCSYVKEVWLEIKAANPNPIASEPDNMAFFWCGSYTSFSSKYLEVII